LDVSAGLKFAQISGQIVMRMKIPKFHEERDIVERLLLLLGHRGFSLHNPNVPPAAETGADVLALLNGQRYGVQVTVLHTDEGQNLKHRGSTLRHQEARFKGTTQPYAAWGNPNPMPALQKSHS
jgi:hypothetical protein